MKHKNILVPLLFLVFLFSCAENSQKENETVPAKKDSLTVNDPALSKVLASFKSDSLPFVADTMLLFSGEKFDSLGTHEVKALSKNWFKHDLNEGADYNLNQFFKIDSIKASGNYSNWCDSLTIGMTKYSNAYAIKKIKLDDSTHLLLWTLVSSSYEACPYSMTRSLYFTIVSNKNIEESFLLALYATWSDPPVASERKVSGTIEKGGKISINVTQTNDQDMDLPELEVTEERYSFEIQSGKLKLLGEKKNSPKKVKRPKQTD